MSKYIYVVHKYETESEINIVKDKIEVVEEIMINGLVNYKTEKPYFTSANVSTYHFDLYDFNRKLKITDNLTILYSLYETEVEKTYIEWVEEAKKRLESQLINTKNKLNQLEV